MNMIAWQLSFRMIAWFVEFLFQQTHTHIYGQRLGIDTCAIINVANIIFIRENWSTIQFLFTLSNEMEFQSSFSVSISVPMKSFVKWIWTPMMRCKQYTCKQSFYFFLYSGMYESIGFVGQSLAWMPCLFPMCVNGQTFLRVVHRKK